MARETIQIEGLNGVLQTLKQLPAEIVSKSGGPIRASLRKAARVILVEAQKNVQKIIDTPNKDGRFESTGLAKKSIRARIIAPSGGLKGEAVIITVKPKQKYEGRTIRRKKRRGGLGKERPLYANDVLFMLENGTEKRPAMPWMRPAFESKKREALDVFTKDLVMRIQRIQKKLEAQNRVKT